MVAAFLANPATEKSFVFNGYRGIAAKPIIF